MHYLNIESYTKQNTLNTNIDNTTIGIRVQTKKVAACENEMEVFAVTGKP